MTKYNAETKQDEPFKGVDEKPISILSGIPSNVKEGVFDVVSGKRIDVLNETVLKYFTKLLADDTRATSIVKKLTIELNESEIEALAAHLGTLKFRTVTPPRFDEVTSEVITKLEDFVALVKARDMAKTKHLKESNKEVYQELREAFSQGKILKNRLKEYFLALYGVNLSAKTVLAKLRIIEPELFGDENLKNKKKALANYLL